MERGYKIRKFRRCPFETYDPKSRIRVRKETTLPFFVRVCNHFVFFGGFISFFVSGILISLRKFFRG